MKTKLLRKLRKKCFIVNGKIYDKESYKHLSGFYETISGICLDLKLIGFNYWLEHVKKFEFNINKKRFNEANK